MNYRRNIFFLLFSFVTVSLFSQVYYDSELGSWVKVADGSIKSTSNSTQSLLNADSVFTGVGELNNYADAMVTVSASHSGLLEVQVSENDITYITIGRYDYRAGGVNRPHVFVKGMRYFRVRFTNTSGSNQTSFMLSTYYGSFNQLNAPSNGLIAQDADAIITRSTDNHEASAGRIDGVRLIHKYGRNSDVDGAEDIWNGGGDYSGFPTTAAETFQILSSSVLDTATSGTGARKIELWYLDDNYNMFDSMGNYLVDTVSLSGTTPVNASVTGMRIWRAKVIESGSTGGNQGVITIRWATTTSVVFASIPAGVGQTELTNFTVPNGYKGYLLNFRLSINDTNTNKADMAIKMRDYNSGTFRLTYPTTISTDYNKNPIHFDGGLVINEKTDFVMRALSVSSTNANITGLYTIRLERN